MLSRLLPPAMALALATILVLVGGRMLGGTTTLDESVIERLDPEDLQIGPDPLVVVEPPSSADEIAQPEMDDFVFDEQDASAVVAVPVPSGAEPPLNEIGSSGAALPEEPPEDEPQEDEPQETAASRMVAPAEVAPPELAGQELQREPPREPLGQLGLAQPPPPPPKNPWAGKPLFRPVAIESAVFESGGHTVAIEGVKSMAADETCSYEGRSWPCGARARGAFRLWLRGRALVCQIPEAEQEQAVMRGKCRLAKQDVGGWLVENGWALADPDGPYAQAGEKARAARLGIFGPPPDTTSVGEVPDAATGRAIDLAPVMTEEGIDPQPSADFGGIFPPAPPPP